MVEKQKRNLNEINEPVRSDCLRAASGKHSSTESGRWKGENDEMIIEFRLDLFQLIKQRENNTEDEKDDEKKKHRVIIKQFFLLHFNRFTAI